MNILKMCYEYPPLGGGGGHVVSGLSKQLVNMGNSVDLITMRFKGLPPFEKTENFSIHRVPCLRSSPVICHSREMITYLCMALPKALKMANDNQYDIIHAHFIFPDGVLGYLVSKLTGIPYIITAHGSDVPGYNPDRFIYQHNILLPLWKTIVKSSSRIICLSRYLESLVKKIHPSVKTAILPNGFDLEKFKANRQKADRILLISRIFKRKGVQYLLKALDGLELDYEVHIVGDGPYLSELKKQAESISANITFHGFVDNDSEKFKELLESAKIFVFPSESENFPIVLLEAMAAGLAIITTRNTGCEEVVGNTALLVNARDVSGIREALLKYTNDPKLLGQAGAAARQRLDDHFSWETVAGRYVEIYDEIKRTIKKGRTSF